MNRTAAAALLVLVLGVTASGKGVTTKIVFTGPDLAAPIEVTDAARVAPFNVWSGPGTAVNNVPSTTGFIADWGAGPVEPPAGLPRYEVSFFVRLHNARGESLAYVVDYEPDSNEGYVFIPGRSDPRFGTNTRSILRREEGRWFRATPEWHRLAASEFAKRR